MNLPERREPAVERAVFFVKYWDKGSTAIGAEQMSEGLRALGVPARSIYASELSGIRDAILVFIKRANWPHLLRARTTGNRCVLDVQDQVVFRRWISHWPLYDAFIFRNRRQLRDFGRQVRVLGNLHALRRTIYQHWDPRYRPHRVPNGALQVAYLGTPRSLSLWGALDGVRCIEPTEWFARASAFNAHLSVRETAREWRYKPGAKVVTAAACDAVLLSTPDDASVELLGEDYPFYLKEPTAEGVEEVVARASGAMGGPLWHEALERLRAVRADTSLELTARRYVELFRELG